MTTNRTILDLSKVQHGTFWWVNTTGQRLQTKPKGPTYLGKTVPEDSVTETNRWRLDSWSPLVVFQLTANHNISYTGKKAIALWKAWGEKIFNKRK